MKKIMIITIIFIITFTYTMPYAEVMLDADTKVGTGEKIAADTLLVRPVGIAAIGVGTVVFVIASPIILFTGDASTVAKELIVDPFDYTFKRPLGHFEYEFATTFDSEY